MTERVSLTCFATRCLLLRMNPQACRRVWCILLVVAAVFVLVFSVLFFLCCRSSLLCSAPASHSPTSTWCLHFFWLVLAHLPRKVCCVFYGFASPFLHRSFSTAALSHAMVFTPRTHMFFTQFSYSQKFLHTKVSRRKRYECWRTKSKGPPPYFFFRGAGVCFAIVKKKSKPPRLLTSIQSQVKQKNASF